MDKKLLDALATKAEQRKADKTKAKRSAVSCLILSSSGILPSWTLMRLFWRHATSRRRCWTSVRS